MTTLCALFDTVATRHGDRVALVDDDTSLTYAELAVRVERVAAYLRDECGVRPGDHVALLLPPSVDLLTALLGILRCGAAYIPLDSQSPTARQQLILDDARPRVLIGADLNEETLHRVVETPGGTCPDLSTADSTAYVIYTSGTTGRPKGVPVKHRNVLALLRSTAPLFGFGPDDVWLLFHSVAFDFSVWEMWGAFAYGGRLVVPGVWTRLSMDSCAQLLVDQGVTVLNQTPTAFVALSKEILNRPERPALRYVVFGGEKLVPSLLRPWVDAVGLDAPRLVNMYGLTEATVHSTYHRVTEADVAHPTSVIGRPLPGFTARVVDGELTVAGPQVTDGYLGRPELTADRFRRAADGHVYYHTGDLVETLATGELRYLGRADRQVKIRGHRLELGEVEAALAGLPDLAAVVVLADGQSLQCFYTSHSGTAADAKELRTRLRALLPQYMIPARFVWLAHLPVTPNGKTDYEALQHDGSR